MRSARTARSTLGVALAIAIVAGCTTATDDDQDTSTLGFGFWDDLERNRDRLVRTIALFPRAAELCAGYQNLPASAKGVFLLVTDRLQKARLPDGSSMLSHVHYIADGGVHGKGSGCGGGDSNRMFMVIDDTLQNALLSVWNEAGQISDAGTAGTSGWQKSKDHPHAPFDASIETVYGPIDPNRVLRFNYRNDNGPRGQIHFFRDPHAARAAHPRGATTVSPIGNWIEMDHDFDFFHRSSTDPSCKYGGKTATERYVKDLGGFAPSYIPCDCEPPPGTAPSACGKLDECANNPAQPECLESPTGGGCTPLSGTPCSDDRDCCGYPSFSYCKLPFDPEGTGAAGECVLELPFATAGGGGPAPGDADDANARASVPAPASFAPGECLSCAQLGQACGVVDTGCGYDVQCGPCAPWLDCLESACASIGTATCTAGEVEFSARGARFPASGGSSSIGATASWCAWAPRAHDGWLSVAASGIGFGSVNLTVPASSGRARITLVETGDARLGVLQDGTSAPFTDVPITHPFAPYIDILHQAGITAGCGPSTYCPDAQITRAQMAIFVIRAIHGGDAFTYPSTPYFTDVPPGSLGFAHIQKMKELGITSGCSATAYCPSAAVTRGQAAVFLVRAALGNSFSYTPSPYFTDVPTTHYFFSYIQKMRDLGITAGCSPTDYCPDAAVTRGQMAVFVVRMFGGVP